MNQRDYPAQLEWSEELASTYPVAEGLELIENPDGLHVGQHFGKSPPVRQPKPGLWARLWDWWCDSNAGPLNYNSAMLADYRRQQKQCPFL